MKVQCPVMMIVSELQLFPIRTLNNRGLGKPCYTKCTTTRPMGKNWIICSGNIVKIENYETVVFFTNYSAVQCLR